MDNTLNEIVKQAQATGSQCLYEHEVYQVLQAFNIKVPTFVFLTKKNIITKELLEPFIGKKIVLKIVADSFLHKSDIDGVRVLNKEDLLKNNFLLSEIDIQIRKKIKEHLTIYQANYPLKFRVEDETLLDQVINEDIKGYLLTEFIEFSDKEFGSELLFGCKWSREFGYCISIGIGGVNTEHYMKMFQKNASLLVFSPLFTSKEELEKRLSEKPFFKKLFGQFRDRKKLIEKTVLLETINNFCEIIKKFPDNFRVSEFEINPMAISKGELVALDGLMKFEPAVSNNRLPVYKKISHLLYPKSFAIIGVSEKISAKQAKQFADQLKQYANIPIELADETLSSKEAIEKLTHKSPLQRGALQHAAAAAVILQRWLDSPANLA